MTASLSFVLCNEKLGRALSQEFCFHPLRDRAELRRLKIKREVCSINRLFLLTIINARRKLVQGTPRTKGWNKSTKDCQPRKVG